MALTALALIFKKVDWIKYLWIGSTLIILCVIVLVKFLFSVIGLIE